MSTPMRTPVIAEPASYPEHDVWATELIRQVQRHMPDRGPFVLVLRGDGQGRLFIHGDGGAPVLIRLRACKP